VSPDDDPELDPVFDDDLELDPVLVQAIRRAYLRPIEGVVADRHLTAIVAAARAEPAALVARNRRRVWRSALAAATATFVMPAGLAVAGVSLPSLVVQPYRAFGIVLPHQPPEARPVPARQSDTSGSSVVRPPATPARDQSPRTAAPRERVTQPLNERRTGAAHSTGGPDGSRPSRSQPRSTKARKRHTTKPGGHRPPIARSRPAGNQQRSQSRAVPAPASEPSGTGAARSQTPQSAAPASKPERKGGPERPGGRSSGSTRK
jgi:hypothetical protein